MKKISLVCLIVLLTFDVAHAQLPFHLGIKGGLNLNALSGKKKTATAIGYHFGPFASVQLGKMGLRTEILASKKGGETELEYTNKIKDIKQITSVVTESDIWYADIPILLDYRVLNLKVAKVHLHAGPQFSFLMSKKLKLMDAVSLKDKSIDKDQLKDAFDYKSSDLSLALGVGVQILMIDAGIRYNIGLSKVDKFDSSVLQNADLKNRTFQIYVGFKFL